MKKVGIITFQCADNFGAVLQCFALSRVVKELGCDVEVINYCPKSITSGYRTLFSLEEIKNGMSSGWKFLIRNILFIKLKNYKKSVLKKFKYNKYKKANIKLTKKVLSYESVKSLPKYDYYIAGSDQIWNHEITKGYDSAYFLEFAPEESKKIAYAASMGVRLLPDKKQQLKELIGNYDYISVREEILKQDIKELTDKSVFTVLDPTMLLNKEFWENNTLPNKRDNDYIFFYAFSYSKENFDFVNMLSDMYDCDIVHFYYGRLARRLKRNGGTFYYDDPNEFLTLIKNAKISVIDSFHGTIFSILFNVPFYTFINSHRGVRLTNLLEELKLEGRILDKCIKPEDVTLDIDFDMAMSLLDKKKEESLNFLKHALDIK